jgi:transposase InsO family protein
MSRSREGKKGGERVVAKRLRKKRTDPVGWKDYLSSIYFNPAHPASFKGAHKVLQAVREDGKYNLTLGQVQEWLRQQESFSLNKPVRRRFKRTPVIATGLRDQFEADLADMQKMAEKNDGVRFLLVVIDVFNRELWVSPLVSKREDTVIAGFKEIFRKTKPPRRLCTDRGKEFTGRKVQNFFKESNIEHWTAHNDEVKANYAERVIRTLKTSLYGYMRRNSTRRYIDILQDSVSSYNNTVHRSTGRKPSEVTEGEVESLLWWRQYKPKVSYAKSQQMQRMPFLFKKGDHVRISHTAKTFERGHDEKWTQEIFTVAQSFRVRDIRKYRLVDLLGETIDGTFYEAELQGVNYDDQGEFEVEEILDRQGSGRRKEVLVKWKGWPEKFNSWVLASTLD